MRIQTMLFLAVFLSTLLVCGQSEEKELLLVVQVMRHGARSPRFTGNLALNTQWTVGPGELTDKGAQQSYQVGRQIQEKYVEELKFLPEVYDPKSITVVSTEFNRTIQTGCNFMEGLYPEQVQKAPKSYNDTRIVDPPMMGMPKYLSPQCSRFPIHVLNYETNYLGLAAEKGVCHNIDYLEKKTLHEIHEKTLPELKPLYDELIEIYEAKPEDMILQKAHPYIDAYEMARTEGMQMEQELSTDAAKLIQKYLKYYINDGWFADDLASKITSTTFFNYLIETFEAKTQADQGNPDYQEFYNDIKYILLPGHDTTISAFMGGIENLDVNYPELASSIFVELYKKGDEYYVTWNYDGKNFNLGKACNSLGECKLEKTVEYFKSRTVNDLHYECNRDIAVDF